NRRWPQAYSSCAPNISSASMLNSRCAMLLGLCMKPCVSSCQGMKPCGAYGARSDGSHGHSISGSSAGPSISCSANTAQLAISKALVTGGRLVNIGAPALAPMITVEAVDAGRRRRDGLSRRHVRNFLTAAGTPQRGIEIVALAARHAHPSVADLHAFGAQAPHLLAETGRTGRQGDRAVAAQDAVPG